MQASLSNESCLKIPLRVFIPNVFTPNGDSLNERFQIKGMGIITYHLQIYNTWGELVFESNDIHKSWDGKDAIEGVYFYKLSATGSTGVQYRKGTVTVVK